jgi:hypothetical protein
VGEAGRGEVAACAALIAVTPGHVDRAISVSRPVIASALNAAAGARPWRIP